MKININILEDINKCLIETLLPIKGTGLTYEINRNLSKIRKSFEEWQSVWDETIKSFYEKGENGGDAEFLMEANKETGRMEFAQDKKGNSIEVKKDTIFKDGQSKGKKVTLNSEYYEAVKDHRNAEIEIELFKFSKDKTKKLFEDGTFDSLNLTPLFGYLIEEHDA